MFAIAIGNVGKGETELILIPFIAVALSNQSQWTTGEGDAYDALLALNKSQKWLEARAKATDLLKENPKSLAANFMLGRSLWLGYGQHAKAMHHFEIAQQQYDKQQKGHPNEPWRMESQILYSMQSIAGDMGKYDRELELIKQYNEKQKGYQQRFETSYKQLNGEKGWPLMKLERYEEAKTVALEAISSDSIWQQSLGHNVMCAVEAELGNREASLLRCEDALKHARESDSGIAIDASNASNASFAALEYEKIERYAIEGTKAGGATAPSWMNLIDLYLLQGRGAAAIEAMKGLRRAQNADPPHLRSQRRADIDATFATVLLLAGETEKGLKAIDAALIRPDRRGTISISEEQTRGGHLLLRLLLKRVHEQRRLEKQSALPLLERLKGSIKQFSPFSSVLSEEAGIRNTLIDENRLISTFRIYIDKGLADVHSYMMGDLVAVVGAGPAQAALNQVKRAETYAKMTSFHSALSADIAYVRRDMSGVFEHANLALQGLPQAEAMLRARMTMLLGWAEKKSGNMTAAVAQYLDAYQVDPSIFRRLGVSLPVRIQSSGVGMGQRVSSALIRSPRFEAANNGFVIDIQGDNDNMSLCLLGPHGESLHCMNAPGAEKTDLIENENGELVEEIVMLTKEEQLVEIVDAFHLQVFGLPMGMFGAEWNTLDGSTNSSRQATQDQIKDLLSQ